MRTRQFSRKDEILLDLLEDNNNISFSGLCIRFKVSERTMRKEISDIKDILKKYELKLVKNKNKLFQIKCENEKDKINIETLKSEIKDNYSKVHYEMRNLASDLEHNAIMQEFDAMYDREQRIIYGE